MMEYKILRTTAKKAEAELNQLARDGWRVVSANVIPGVALTVDGTPMIVALEREATL